MPPRMIPVSKAALRLQAKGLGKPIQKWALRAAEPAVAPVPPPIPKRATAERELRVMPRGSVGRELRGGAGRPRSRSRARLAKNLKIEVVLAQALVAPAEVSSIPAR